MMKRFGIIIAALTLCGSVAFSQGMLEAYRFGQTDLQGTARYVGMGGAFGALGGDISAMSKNPAGLAVYKSSEVVTTLSMSFTKAKTDWLGTKIDNNKNKFNFDNIAYVGYFPTGNDVGIVSWNAGFAYNRVKNFQRHYYMSTKSLNYNTSLSDYMAARAYGVHVDDLRQSSANDHAPYAPGAPGDWLSVLGYNGGLIQAYGDDPRSYYSPFGNEYNTPSGDWEAYGIDEALMNVSESGAIDKYDIAFGMNISEIVLLGATFSITDINYRMHSSYDEFLVAPGQNGDDDWFNDFYLDNGLSTDGTGYAFNLGAIVKPTDYLRLGVAYNSPTWYKMTDYYYGDAGSYLTWYEKDGFHDQKKNASTPNNNPYTDYEYRSPDRWIFSAAGIIGQSALVSVDYELTNYSNMKLKDDLGNENPYSADNSDIKNNFRMGQTIRLGAEVRVTPQFSVRAGGSFTNSPMKDPFKNALEKNEMEVFTVGTVPHFTIDKGSSSYSVGLGYRFTPQFYTDLACVLTSYKEDVYAFSPIPDAGIETQSATLKTNRTKVALTVGYKF